MVRGQACFVLLRQKAGPDPSPMGLVLCVQGKRQDLTRMALLDGKNLMGDPRPYMNSLRICPIFFAFVSKYGLELTVDSISSGSRSTCIPVAFNPSIFLGLFVRSLTLDIFR